jgi:hypothetical protein
VGWVLEAYATADLRLLGEPLPLVTLDELKLHYPEFGDRLNDPQVRADLGIGEGESWPVALVGYVLHSLNRKAAEIRDLPYSPKRGDEFFPRLGQPEA